MRWLKPQTVGLYSLGLTLVFLIACGAAAPAGPEEEAAPAPAEPVQPQPAPQEPAAPVAEPTPTPAVPAVVVSSGTLNVGQKELGSFDGHPKMVINPALFVSQTAPVGEGLLYPDIKLETQGWLLESWSISDDFLTWTLNIREGVQFRHGYGEMTAEDVAWSYVEGSAENDTHVRIADFRDFWTHPEGSVEAQDDYTVVVNTGAPIGEAVALQGWIWTPGGSSNWVASKQQSQEMGTEAASMSPALTGPWEFVEERPAQLWRMRAVEDHWRQTPHFAELVFWEIPEESSRIAGFQTGQLDTFNMAFDTIPLVENIPGARLMQVPGAIESGLLFYGNYLSAVGTAEQYAAYDPSLPWITASPDVDSPEWREAALVRQALSIAIDREALLDTLLWGFGRPSALWLYGLNEHLLEGRQWEFNPEQARELLTEAGYPDGFRITLTPSLRGAPAEVEACEAIGQMWGDIGVDVRFQRIPYETLRPQLVGRTYQGATCHAASARQVVSPLTSSTTLASFNHGGDHPWLDEMIFAANSAVDNEDRERLEAEMGAFFFDNAWSIIGLYVIDTVWPVGTRIEEWMEHVKTRDLRDINGYEYIRHR